jgi:hypothetical protein
MYTLTQYGDMIAEKIVAVFPAAFKNSDAALARIGTLSDRYSR